MLKIAMVIVALSVSVMAKKTICPTLPGTNIRDYSKPCIVVEDDGDIYQTLPGSSAKDYSKPGYKVEGNTIHQTIPGTSIRDYSKPSSTYQIK